MAYFGQFIQYEFLIPLCQHPIPLRKQVIPLNHKNLLLCSGIRRCLAAEWGQVIKEIQDDVGNDKDPLKKVRSFFSDTIQT